MGVPSSTSAGRRAAAMSAACSAIRSNPKLAHWAATSQEDAAKELSAFIASDDVHAWLRGVRFSRWLEAVASLLSDAESWVYGGEAEALVQLYSEQRDAVSGPTRRAVHKAVFSLAVGFGGSPLLASLRSIGIVVAVQSRIVVSHAVIDRQVRKLMRDGFIEYTPGTPGLHGGSGLIAFPPAASATLDDPGVEAEMALTSSALLALHEYREQARRGREERSRAAQQRYAEIHAQRVEAARIEAEVNRQLTHALVMGLVKDGTFFKGIEL